MKGCAGFWVGMSAGLLAGAAMGMMSPYGRDPICAEQKEQGGLCPPCCSACRKILFAPLSRFSEPYKSSEN